MDIQKSEPQKRSKTIRFKRQGQTEQLMKGSPKAAAYDIAYEGVEKIHIKKGEIKVIPTGLQLEMPNNIEAQIRTRSGLATQGIMVLNSPGTINPDYTGEIKVILINLGPDEVVIEPGKRIAQLTFSRIISVKFIEGITEKKTRRKKGSGSAG